MRLAFIDFPTVFLSEIKSAWGLIVRLWTTKPQVHTAHKSGKNPSKGKLLETVDFKVPINNLPCSNNGFQMNSESKFRKQNQTIYTLSMQEWNKYIYDDCEGPGWKTQLFLSPAGRERADMLTLFDSNVVREIDPPTFDLPNWFFLLNWSDTAEYAKSSNMCLFTILRTYANSILRTYGLDKVKVCSSFLEQDKNML